MNRIQAWWARIRQPKTAETDRERIRNILVKEATYAAALAGFVTHAYNHGHGVRITLHVDGEQCGIAILAHAKEPLIEYLAQWSCAQKLVKQDRLGEFDKEGGVGLPVAVDLNRGLHEKWPWGILAQKTGPESDALGAKQDDQAKKGPDYLDDMGA
jgi:hypothetical protein